MVYYQGIVAVSIIAFVIIGGLTFAFTFKEMFDTLEEDRKEVNVYWDTSSSETPIIMRMGCMEWENKTTEVTKSYPVYDKYICDKYDTIDKGNGYSETKCVSGHMGEEISSMSFNDFEYSYWTHGIYDRTYEKNVTVTETVCVKDQEPIMESG